MAKQLKQPQNSAKGAQSVRGAVKYIIQLVYVCVSADEELQSEDELDKELLWNLQLLSEVRGGTNALKARLEQRSALIVNLKK